MFDAEELLDVDMNLNSEDKDAGVMSEKNGCMGFKWQVGATVI